MKGMEAIKAFTRPAEKKIEELENALKGSSDWKRLNCIDKTPLVVNLFKSRISSLEKLPL